MKLQNYKEVFHFSVNFFSIFLLITFIPDILHIDNTIIKNAFWVLKALLAFWVIYMTKNSLVRFSPMESFFLVVAIIYIANIYVDIYINPLPFLKSTRGNMDFLAFFLGLFIALSFRFNPAIQSEKSFKFFWLSLTAGLIIAYFLAIENTDLEVTGARYDANSTITTIMYGQSGGALALISIFGMVHFDKRIYKFLFLITLIIGILSIAKAGSRSPIIIILLITIFFLIARIGKFKGLILVSVLLGSAILFLNPILELLDSMGSSLGTRLTSTVEDGDTSGRDYIYSNVLRIIRESPLLGAYYFIPSGAGFNSYPHNFFLEVFMATGFLGGVPFLILVFLTLIKAFNLLKARHPSSWIVIIYLQIVSYGMFSTSLYGSQEFWALLFFMTSVKLNTIQAKYKPFFPLNNTLTLSH